MANEDEVGALRKLYQELQAENAKLKDELKRYRNAFDALKRLVEVIQAPISATIDFANMLTAESHTEETKAKPANK
jgi:uncharacterized protein YlxW (UPF0749 family)